MYISPLEKVRKIRDSHSVESHLFIFLISLFRRLAIEKNHKQDTEFISIETITCIALVLTAQLLYLVVILFLCCLDIFAKFPCRLTWHIELLVSSIIVINRRIYVN